MAGKFEPWQGGRCMLTTADIAQRPDTSLMYTKRQYNSMAVQATLVVDVAIRDMVWDTSRHKPKPRGFY